MPNFTTIPNSSVDPESPITAELMTALRDNAITKSWMYYNDTNGVVYDHSVDGTVATIVSPDFDDGYEYLFVFSSITQSGSSDSTPVVNVEAYFDNDAAYAGPAIFGATSNSTFLQLVVLPRIGIGALINAPSGGDPLVTATDTTSNIDRLRFTISGTGGSFTGGKIIMLRRHNGL